VPIDIRHHFTRDQRGNVAVIFALALLPIMFLIGMTIDYSTASQIHARLQAAADAAALAAVTPGMLNQSDQASITAAQNAFNAQVANITGLNYSSKNLGVQVVDNALTRTVTVTYSASSQNVAPNILRQAAWPLTGSSQASAAIPPNIDFYLLLDNSPSMNIAATTAGIATMVANTKSQGGCAFACHESNPKGDNLGNPDGVDNYTLAQQLGVVTRIQNLNAATQALMVSAGQTEATYNSTYRMAIYTFNSAGVNTVAPLTSSLSTAKTAAAGIDVLEVYQNNWLTSKNNNSDEDTDFETAMSNVNGIMPNPGTGLAGSTPQDVLFLVSDGVDDNNVGGSRNQALFDTTWCTTVKNRNIRIAVLYTAYLPLTTNSWYNTYIAPFQSQIAGNMQSCASPGLYYQVTTDGDITAAMQGLFQAAVTTAHLTH